MDKKYTFKTNNERLKAAGTEFMILYVTLVKCKKKLTLKFFFMSRSAVKTKKKIPGSYSKF